MIVELCYGYSDPIIDLYSIAAQHIKLFFSVILVSTMIAIVVAIIRIYGRAFLLMTLVWNLINFAIGCWLLDHIQLYEIVTAEWLRKHLFFLFEINLALDILYLLTGVLLYIKSKKIAQRLEMMFVGFAYAVLLQGISLLLIDTITYIRIAIN